VAAGILNITIEQGATFRLRLTFKSGGVIVPLTNQTARMHIRSSVPSTQILVALTSTNGGLTINGVNGTIDMFISDDDTAAFTFKQGVYDLELEDTVSGDVVRVLQGAVRVSPEVTR
jgi:hypothetical protein